jgi:hypothetical protein
MCAADSKVDRADRHLLPEWGERFPHMLRLREYVEDECDRSVELSGDDNLKIVRNSMTADPCRLGVTAALLVVVAL